MYFKNMFAAGALLSVVAAVPMAKRDVVWVTETDAAIVTVPVTTTVWVNPDESIPTGSASLSHYGHHRSHVSTHVQSTVTVAATSSSETGAEAPSSYEAPSSTSVYVAPTPSSTSVYVAPTSTSVYVAPTTSSTSVYIAPTTSSAPAPTTYAVSVAPTTTSTSVYIAPTTSSASVPTTYAVSSTSAPAASGTSTSGSTYTGDITHYDVGMGSCGWTNDDSEAVVAIPHGMMNNGPNPNNNPLCGQYITISYEGATHQAKVVDTCGGCDGASIDLSPTLFTAVAPSGDGRVSGVEWWFDGSS